MCQAPLPHPAPRLTEGASPTAGLSGVRETFLENRQPCPPPLTPGRPPAAQQGEGLEAAP